MAAYTDPVISKHGRSIPAGTLIYREGAPAEEVFILQRGSVRLCTSVRGEEFCLAELADGDLFGDEVLGARRRQSSALAVRDVEAVVVDASTFLRILDESREVRRRIVDKLASRLQETTARLVRQVAQGDTSRLASVLQGGGGSSPEDLAGRAGLLPSRSALLLDRLQRAGLISEGRWAASAEALAEFVEYCEWKERFDPLDLQTLAALTGMGPGAMETLAGRVIRRHGADWAGDPGEPLWTPYQRYLYWKSRYELAGAAKPPSLPNERAGDKA